MVNVGGADSAAPLDAAVQQPYADGALARGADTDLGGEAPDGTLLQFAVFGDARPPIVNEASGYPTAVLQGIFSRIVALSPQFVIGTGDYMYAITTGGVAAQLALFRSAIAAYTGPLYLAMGNHECNGITESNCPNLNEWPNVQSYIANMLPAGVTLPYYRFDKDTRFGKAKFIIIAPNAWTDAQATWFTTQLADPTTYTFVIRHEPSGLLLSPPGVAPSDAAMTNQPLTVAFYGHTHTYEHVDAKHVISGNAGAPLVDTTSSFGFLWVTQQTDGSIAVSSIAEATGMTLDSWRVSATGQALP